MCKGQEEPVPTEQEYELNRLREEQHQCIQVSSRHSDGQALSLSQALWLVSALLVLI